MRDIRRWGGVFGCIHCFRFGMRLCRAGSNSRRRAAGPTKSTAHGRSGHNGCDGGINSRQSPKWYLKPLLLLTADSVVVVVVVVVVVAAVVGGGGGGGGDVVAADVAADVNAAAAASVRAAVGQGKL
jgi:hypothetical protein